MAESELDTDKLDDAALAILSLTLHDGDRVWCQSASKSDPVSASKIDPLELSWPGAA